MCLECEQPLTEPASQVIGNDRLTVVHASAVVWTFPARHAIGRSILIAKGEHYTLGLVESIRTLGRPWGLVKAGD